LAHAGWAVIAYSGIHIINKGGKKTNPSRDPAPLILFSFRAMWSCLESLCVCFSINLHDKGAGNQRKTYNTAIGIRNC
jgi:hypothetical protein